MAQVFSGRAELDIVLQFSFTNLSGGNGLNVDRRLESEEISCDQEFQ